MRMPCATRHLLHIESNLVHILQMCSAEEKSRAAEAARTLHFAPALTQLADKVLAGMEANGLVPFNALHLRMERDAKEWTEYMGGLEVRCMASIQASWCWWHCYSVQGPALIFCHARAASHVQEYAQARLRGADSL